MKVLQERLQTFKLKLPRFKFRVLRQAGWTLGRWPGQLVDDSRNAVNDMSATVTARRRPTLRPAF